MDQQLQYSVVVRYYRDGMEKSWLCDDLLFIRIGKGSGRAL